MSAAEDVAEAVVEAGKRCSLTKSVLREWVYLSMKKSTLCYVDNRHFDSDHADRFTRGRGRHVTTAPAC